MLLVNKIGISKHIFTNMLGSNELAAINLLHDNFNYHEHSSQRGGLLFYHDSLSDTNLPSLQNAHIMCTFSFLICLIHDDAIC